MPYCHVMAAALAAADLVICRAGASTVAELLVARKPALLVPFPFASENHQFYNAEVLLKRGVAEVIADADFSPEKVAECMRLYFRFPDRLPQMHKRLAVLAEEQRHAAAAHRLAAYMTQ
jgi:UDP-N-acetylglucosamine--N-acetylmuramyl-(pentapeptide) pyrophosphoryl-undecaprenol N-acetylglucosamine transferase